MEKYSREIEREVKILLTKQQYDAVCAYFEWEHVIDQINYYYMDKNGKLSAKRINVRVREKNGSYKLEVKSLVENVAGGPSIHREVSRDIDGVPEFIDRETVKDMTDIDDAQAYLVGSLRTLRRLYHAGEKGNIEICLDKSEYLGTIDYELELEYTGDVLGEVLQIVSELNLNADIKPQGKLARFYKRYNEMR